MTNHPNRSAKSFIPFVRDEDGDYRAEFEGLRLVIVKATTVGFGYYAHRIEPHAELTGPGIRWVRTKRNCLDGLERIVERERALNQNIADQAAATPKSDIVEV